MIKKSIFLFAVILISANSFGQNNKSTAEVLYFKANLACCQAKSCNALEGDVKKVIDTKFATKGVNFKEIKLSDASNAELVRKYNAKSQTVIVVVTKNGKQTSTDISQMVKDHLANNDYPKFEKELTVSINTALK